MPNFAHFFFRQRPPLRVYARDATARAQLALRTLTTVTVTISSRPCMHVEYRYNQQYPYLLRRVQRGERASVSVPSMSTSGFRPGSVVAPRRKLLQHQSLQVSDSFISMRLRDHAHILSSPILFLPYPRTDGWRQPCPDGDATCIPSAIRSSLATLSSHTRTYRVPTYLLT